MAFLESLLGSRAPAVLRMGAALALAFHGRVSGADVAAMLDSLPPSAHPDAVAAIALAGGTGALPKALSAYPDNRLLRWVGELATEHRKDPGPLL